MEFAGEYQYGGEDRKAMEFEVQVIPRWRQKSDGICREYQYGGEDRKAIEFEVQVIPRWRQKSDEICREYQYGREDRKAMKFAGNFNMEGKTGKR